MGRGDGVLVGGRTLEDEARRYWTTTPAGFHTGATTALIRTHREPKDYRFHPSVLAVSVSLDHERPERSSNPLAGASVAAGIFQHVRQLFWLGTYTLLS